MGRMVSSLGEVAVAIRAIAGPTLRRRDVHHSVAVDPPDWSVRAAPLHGTHTAPFLGIPATGRRVTVAAHVILHTDDAGAVKALFGVFDEAGMLRQLGVLPG